MFLGAAMMGLTRIVMFTLLLVTLAGPRAEAQEADLAQRFQAEQALVARLSASQLPEDQHQLAELYRDGLIFSASNPIRKAERDAAIAAYRRAIELGDRSAAAAVSLGRLLLRDAGGMQFDTIMPELERLALEGNGDALYLLAADALENKKQGLDQVTPSCPLSQTFRLPVLKLARR
jgi:TPR repeat protein